MNRGRIHPAAAPEAIRASFIMGLGGILDSSMMHATSIARMATIFRP
jgi:hypothetical protein